jgi:transposase
MSQILNAAIAVVGIDIGKNTFHVVGLDRRGAIMLRQKWSRGQVEARCANMPPCLIGVEACVGAHHLSRKLKELGHSPVPSAALFGANDSTQILAKRMVKGIKTSQHQAA